MSHPQDDFDDTWAGLTPEQPPDSGKWLKWVLGGGLTVAVLLLCGASVFLLAREFLGSPTAVPLPPVPTDENQAAATQAVVERTEGTEPPTPEVIVLTEPAPTEAAPTVETAPTVTIAPTEEAPPPTNGANVDAFPLTSPPLLDGDLSEWSAIPGVASAFRVFQVAGWDGSDDLTAVWRLGWDASNLYVAVAVEDNVHVQTQTGNQIFRGDSVDMQFDTDRAGDFGPGLSPDDYQITLSPGDFITLPPSAFRFRGRADGRILDEPGHSVLVAAAQVIGGYNLEAAIPWADLGLTPGPGLVIGLALNANDNDTPGTAVQEVMMSHVATRTLTDPDGWGTLTLR